MKNTNSLKSVELPEIFQLELTNVCNLNCTICPHSMMKRPQGYISFDLIKKIVERDVGNTNIIGLHLLGESLLHPQFVEIVEYLGKHGIDAELATNAIVLTKELTERIVKSGIKTIWFSFDGSTKEEYESIRRGADFDKVVKNIRQFLEINKKNGNKVHTIVQMVNVQKTATEKKDFIKFWQDSGATEVKVKFLDSWAGTLFNDIISQPKQKRTPCEEPWKRVAVLYNGDVVPCCRDWNGACVYGNLNKNSLLEIWNGEIVAGLRKEMLINKYKSEPCKSCKEWHIPMNRMIHKKEE